MTNINKTLRLSRNTSLLFAAASGLLCLSACSSDVDSPNGQEIPETPVEGASYTVYGANPNRIHNFGSNTRAAVDFTMPECPTESVYANLPTTEKIEYGWEIDRDYKGQDMLIPAGTTFGRFAGSAKYYVAGTLDWSTGEDTILPGTEIYVLPGGQFLMGGTLDNNLTVYNYGEVEINNGLTIGGKLYSTSDIIAKGEIGIDGGIYCKGSVSADKVRLDGECFACAFIADDLVNERNVGTIKTSYLKASKLTLHSSKVILDNNGLVDVDKLGISNQDTRFVVDGTNAVVHAKVYDTNNKDWGKYHFEDAKIALDFESLTVSGSPDYPYGYWDQDLNQYISGTRPYEYADFGFVVSDENRVVYVPAGDCHPSYGKAPEGTTPDEPIVVPEIVKITEIDPLDEEINHGNHDHGIISATCINFSGNIAYASYHLRGEGQKGCIEVFRDNGSGHELGSYMISPEYDYNHLIVDGNRIITVGNHARKGAFIGALSTDFEASEGVREDFQVKELTTDERIYSPSEKDPEKEIATGYKNAGDGNCIVEYNGQYYVTTYRGYGVLNKDFTKVPGSFVETAGSCKHLSVKDGKTAVISLDTYDKTSSTASVYTFGLPNGTFGDVLNRYNAIGTVEPVDGKNVIAIDGDDIYACLSHGGLARIRGGQVETKTFGKNSNAPVNGMAIDEKYLYIAAGAFVFVLDKETMEEVCHYYAQSQKSSNYIALNNGKIYVAYGEEGIMAFQIVEKEIEQ